MGFDILIQKEKLDALWENVPEYSKYDRFAPRELRNPRIKSDELSAYEAEENTFIAMVRLVFNLKEKISLSDAYDLIERKLNGEKGSRD